MLQVGSNLFFLDLISKYQDKRRHRTAWYKTLSNRTPTRTPTGTSTQRVYDVCTRTNTVKRMHSVHQAFLGGASSTPGNTRLVAEYAMQKSLKGISPDSLLQRENLAWETSRDTKNNILTARESPHYSPKYPVSIQRRTFNAERAEQASNARTRWETARVRMLVCPSP